jgi:outer membrane protein TolC
MLKRQTAIPVLLGLMIGGGTAISRSMEAQISALSQPASGAISQTVQGQSPQQTASQTRTPLTLEDAIHLAEVNEPMFAAAVANAKAAGLERTDARAALLPSATVHTGAIYTEPNGHSNRIGQIANQPSPVFIQNNAVREYSALGLVNETVGLRKLGDLRLADANLARASAEMEIARRGLSATVANLYYSVCTQDERVSVAERAVTEADHFLQITQEREQAREAAHADVIKAQIQQQQRQREVSDAKLAADKARLELGVLLFADPSTPYDLVTVTVPPPLPERAAVEAAAKANNPEVRSAMASLQVSRANTFTARAALLPDLGINVTYGIDAPQFAAHGPDNTLNLGYAGSAALDLPVWDWLTGERKVKEAKILQGAAKTAVTAAQRRALADLSEFYAEAATAQSELASLDKSVIDSQESLRLTNMRYADGEGTVFEVVDAQNTLVTAQSLQIDGKMRYQMALAQLQTLTGKL